MSPTTTETLQERFPDLEFTPLLAPSNHPHYHYNGFQPGTTVLPKGHVRSTGKKPFPTEVIWERDVSIPMRDGVKVYADIFYPANSVQRGVPAIISWSPYGKTGAPTQQYEMMGPFRCGVAPEMTSGYEKFEGTDPAEWCGRGYAITNVDARGAGMSEGNIAYWGIQEAEDIYDTIDWLATQSWCNGSVAMAGNSWFAIAQINFASRLKHRALKALAPWEALSDPYRHVIARGGKPHLMPFHKLVFGGLAGPSHIENMTAMLSKRPLYDEYWDSKYIKTENIDVPIYLTASYSSSLHTAGSFHTYRTAKTQEKWLRVHPYQEWYDLYRPEVNDDLQKFLDRYCKGIANGWEHDTPPVRLSLLGFDGSLATTITERTEMEYPLARQQLQRYYLDVSSHSLVEVVPETVSSASHEAHSLNESTDFTLRFIEYTEIAGYAKVRLYMSCAEHDDMDVAVQIRKIGRNRRLLEHLNYPCPISVDRVPNVNVAKTVGSQGFLRASHAVSRDESNSTEQEVFYRHDHREPVRPLGKIVQLDITLWPMGIVFAAGEGIMLRISGHDMCYPEAELLRLTEPDDENIGRHTIWTGEKYASHLVLPIIPKTE